MPFTACSQQPKSIGGIEISQAAEAELGERDGAAWFKPCKINGVTWVAVPIAHVPEKGAIDKWYIYIMISIYRDTHDEACSVDVVLFYFLFSVVVGRNLSMKVILTCDEEFYTPKPNKSNKPNYHRQLGFSPRLRMRIKTSGWTLKKARNPRMRPLYFIYPPSLGPSMKLWSNYFRDSRAFREILNPKLSSEKFDCWFLFGGMDCSKKEVVGSLKVFGCNIWTCLAQKSSTPKPIHGP